MLQAHRHQDDRKIIDALREDRYILQMAVQNEKHVSIWASRAPTRTHHDSRFMFQLVFMKEAGSGKKYMVCYELDKEDGAKLFSWKTDLEPSTDLLRFAEQRFAQISEIWKNRKIQVDGFFYRFKRNDDFSEMEAFKNLDLVKVDKDFIEAIWRQDAPFTSVFSQESRKWKPWMSREWDYLYSPYNGVLYDKFLKCGASRINIHVGTHTPEQIFSFIKLWKLGQVMDSLEWVIWNLQNSTFEDLKLWSLLGASEENLCSCFGDPILIEMHDNPGRIGRLYRTGHQLRFFVDINYDKGASTFSRIINSSMSLARNLLDYCIAGQTRELENPLIGSPV